MSTHKKINKEIISHLVPLFIGIGYILLIYILGGLKIRHVLVGSTALLYYVHPRTQKFIKYFFPFLLVGASYDFMRYFYWQGIEGHVHIKEPYFLEKKWFGILLEGKILTPNEFFQIKTFKILDFFCGIAYLTFVFWYLGFAFLLFFKKNYGVLRRFGWCFFTVNIMGFMTYFIYPAAPPWYVEKYGLGPAIMHVASSPAGTARFDALFGTHFFTSMYGESVDIYGAIPSLHVAYPFLVAWGALQIKKYLLPTVMFYLLMCFSAVYLNHHYIIDIILGTIYSVVAIAVVKKLVPQNAFPASRAPQFFLM